MKRLLFSLLLIILIFAGWKNTEESKPNFIFIMMDDYGFGQFAAHNDTIEVQDFDSLFLAFERERNNYSPEQALEFSRKATPTLEEMAGNGILFTNAYTPSNLCAPSRIAVATGIHQNKWGIYRNIDCEQHGLKPGSHLVEELHNNGYRTAHIGKWHMGSRNRELLKEACRKNGLPDTLNLWQLRSINPELAGDLENNGYMGSVIDEHHALNNGFDYYFGYNMWESPFYNAKNVWENFKPAGIIKDYNTDVFTSKALDFIDSSLDENKPFFVQIHYHAVHAPLEPKAPDEYFDRFNSASFILNNFYAHVFAVDESVRKLHEYLKSRGEDNNTMIVFTSDNGGSVGGRSSLPGNAPYIGHKGMYTLGGIRSPLSFFWPDGVKKPHENHQLVSTLDIMPTILDAAGIDVPDGLDGKSLLPYLRNESDKPVHEYLFWSGIHARAWGFMSHTSFLPALQARERAPSSWVVIKEGWMMRYIDSIPANQYKDCPDGKAPQISLFNIYNDPDESDNLVQIEDAKKNELHEIWEMNAKHFPPPVWWSKEKWEGIVPSDNIYLNKESN